MKCQICKTELVQSNINYGSEYLDYEGQFYTQYFCFGCGIMYSCTSDSGDFLEENLEIHDFY